MVPILIGILATHYAIGSFADKLCLPHQGYCINMICSALQNKCHQFLDAETSKALNMVKNVPLRELAEFFPSSKWLKSFANG